MRYHMYNQFLGTQIHPLNIKNMLGNNYQDLVDHFGNGSQTEQEKKISISSILYIFENLRSHSQNGSQS